MFLFWFRINKSHDFCLHKRFVVPLFCYLFVLSFALLSLTGCAWQQHFVGASKDSYQILPSKYKKKALDCEANGLYREAMQSWWIFLSFHPDNPEIKERIDMLRKKIQTETDDHFNRGRAFFQKDQFRSARREFLLTLAYDQDHELALDYLENKLQRPVFREYVVRPGDTLKIVASREYENPNIVSLIMAFNDIDNSGKLVAGKLLQLPLLDKDFFNQEKKIKVISQNSAISLEPIQPKNKARAPVSYENTPPQIALTIDHAMPDPKHDLENYQKARVFLGQEKYKEALQLLVSIDINFRDVRQLITTVQVFIQQEADAHYRKGISYFLSKNLDKAIMEWEEVIRLSPTHLKAEKDLKNARKIKQKIKEY